MDFSQLEKYLHPGHLWLIQYVEDMNARQTLAVLWGFMSLVEKVYFFLWVVLMVALFS